MTKVLAPPALQFKGSGFYITDYTNKGKPPESKKSEDKKAESKASSDKSQGSKPAETKPAERTTKRSKENK